MELNAETKYKLFAQISQEIRDTLDLDHILNHLLDMVHSVMEFDAAGIFVLNEDFFEPRRRRERGLIGGIAMRGFDVRPPSVDPMLGAGKGIIGHVIRTGECVIARDVRDDPHYVAGRKGTLSEIAVPIVRDERAIGALNLESDRLGAYSQSNLEVLRFFADAAAISIEKAVLHRRIMESKHIEEQLRVAREVQSRLLPEKPATVPGYDVAGISLSTFEIGGDYFDYISLPDGKLGVTVADVSGQGVPAALIMTAFRALLRTQARREPEPERVAMALKQMFPEFVGEDNYVSAVYGVLDPLTGRFVYVNCGHEAPMHVHADGSIEQLGIGGPVLSGVLADAAYRTQGVTLARGDLLILYTDGVVEVGADEGEEFGEERLKSIVREARHLPGAEIIRALVEATREFSGSESFRDDFTLVVVRRA